MYHDVVQWVEVRRRILKDGLSQRQVCRDTGIDERTLRKMLAHPLPQPYGPRGKRNPKLGPHVASIRRLLEENGTLPPSARLSMRAIYERIRDSEGFRGGYSTVKDFVRTTPPVEDFSWEWAYDVLMSLEKRSAINFLLLLSRADPPVISLPRARQFFRDTGRVNRRAPNSDKRAEAQRNAFEWMRAVLQKDIGENAVYREIGDLADGATLFHRLYTGPLSDRNRSMTVLANRRGLSRSTICRFLSIDMRTCRKYLQTFEFGGAAALFARSNRSTRKFDDETIKKAVFGLLHEPPSNYGINRTTWIIADLSRILREKGCSACPDVIRKITKTAGYRWLKAKKVLTSRDPDYRTKLDDIQRILGSLAKDEGFFSIDEYGPFAVKRRAGRQLVPPGEIATVPQWQKSKGALIMTAALELSTNQVTHFYSEKKDTEEMIKLLDILLERNRHLSRIYLSWDAASWHISKRLSERIASNNVMAHVTGSARVEVAPLPAGAQFLNVIESVFSGMARAIIHNSDYQSTDTAKAAIDRYFEDRNANFLQHIRRAGNKIWGKERAPTTFSEASNCKDPRYR